MTQAAQSAQSRPYRDIYATPGAKGFSGAGFVARMPMSMTGLAIVLVISELTGSYALAGSLSAVYTLAYGAATPLAGRLVDRLGQGRVLFPQVLINVSADILFVVLTVLHAPVGTLFPVAAAMGLTTPSVGGLVRARWAHVLRDAPDRLATAYAIESTADEVAFVVGPVLVTVIAAQIFPASGLLMVGALTLAGGLVFAAQRATEPVPHPVASGTGRAAVLARGMPGLAVVFLLLGCAFGSMEVIMVAYAQEHGHRSLAGVILAVWSAGSGVSGLWYGARTWRATLRRRMVTSLVALAAGMTMLPLIASLPLMTVLIFIPGLAIAGTLIPCFGLVERLVPAGRLTEGFATASTAIAMGMALAAPIAGRLIDSFGARAALLCPAVALWAAVACALAASARWAPAPATTQPG